jgi:hypothetical protein
MENRTDYERKRPELHQNVGPDTGDFVAGDEVFGATNPSFINCRSEPLR